MKPIQLLGVGKTFMGLRQEKVRYAFRSGLAIPKFEPPRRSIPGEVAGHPNQTELASVEAKAQGQVQAQGQAQVQVQAPDRRQPAAVQEDRSAEKRQIAVERAEIPVAPKVARSNWNDWKPRPRLNPFAARRQRRPSGPLVQGELNLEQVRVVRNDLTESDLAVVRVRTPAVPVFEAKSRAIDWKPLPVAGWRRWAAAWLVGSRLKRIANRVKPGMAESLRSRAPSGV